MNSFFSLLSKNLHTLMKKNLHLWHLFFLWTPKVYILFVMSTWVFHINVKCNESKTDLLFSCSVYVLGCVCTKSLQLCLALCKPWTVAHQAPPSMGFSRQEYWSGVPFPSPEDLPHPGIEPESLMSPALAGRFFITSTIWEALSHSYILSNHK